MECNPYCALTPEQLAAVNDFLIVMGSVAFFALILPHLVYFVWWLSDRRRDRAMQRKIVAETVAAIAAIEAKEATRNGTAD
ncbi:hypothetical protein WDL40_11265 [Xanthomonas arboricola pv. pruni]|uniref:Uncharacterized protein n=2 Tax=Xanthomonas arboricola pv. pruni TaxID=69929 RepID=A0AAP4KDV6_9XANT|nr:hypothetical protein [Xanthomonas arboricola]MDN0289145.1 hypothetical protein [Xanthomonas arboricola pv. pruni]MDN0293297.1 hypothetical protein [Xanthomonas arboricola pv. pruni]MDN0297399.1 hypothetical protein [Xanthomonas arboricola pv. pruni]MDN0301505.1 hypothetical protein [Xanthomonas arboricola pv. pruni]MDN0305640.1 hypothetical protein [Xanthomonas arboricola pv. pruni]